MQIFEIDCKLSVRAKELMSAMRSAARNLKYQTKLHRIAAGRRK
jgi:hypothetical protein